MSFQLVLERGPIIDLGPTVELFTAFQDLADAVGPGDAEYPQLFYVPQTNEEPLPDWVVTAMAQQASEALQTTTGLDAHTVWVLQQIAQAHGPVTKYRDDQPRVPAGNPDGGQWAGDGDSGGSGTATATGVDDRPPVGLSAHGWYSFPRNGAFTERYIKSVPLDDAITGINLYGDFTEEALDIVRANLGHPKAKPGEYLVYRVGGGHGRGLAGVNAGTLRGVLGYLQYTFEELIQTGDHLEVYGVVFDKEPISDYKPRHRNDPKSYWAWVVRGYPEFDPDQPRDEGGRWGGGGGGGAGRDGGTGGSHTESVEEAYKLLTEEQRVILAKPEMVSTLLDKIAAEADKAEKAGGKAVKINLCNVSVTGTNIFCGEHRNIPRLDMPQLGGFPKAGSKAESLPRQHNGGVDIGHLFVEHVQADHGLHVTNETINSSFLKATQRELDGAKVAGLMKAMEAGKIPETPLFVSQDNYIVDGHHRWAAKLGLDLRHDRDLDRPIPIIRVDTDIIDVLVKARNFAGEMGIPVSGSGDFKPPKAAHTPVIRGYPEYNPDQPRDEHGRFGGGGGGAEGSGLPSDVQINAHEGAIRSALEGKTNWTVKLKETRDHWNVPTYEMAIVPRGTQQGYERSGDYLYDPTLARLETDIPVLGPRPIPTAAVVTSIPAVAEPNTWFRGMSADEFRHAVKEQRVLSRGDYNLGGPEEGLTFYSTDPEQSSSYAGGFAPWPYVPTGSNPAYVIQVKAPGRAEIERDTERGHRPAIAWDQVTAIYEGRPYAMKDGSVDLVPGHLNQYREGSRSSPSSWLHWRKLAPSEFSTKDYTKYSDDQPRVPAGNPDGGQWSAGDGGGSSASGNSGPVPEAGTLVDVKTVAIRALNGRSEEWVKTHITPDTPWSRRTLKSYVTWVNEQPEVGPLKEMLRTNPDLHPAIEIGHDEHSTIPRADKPVTYLLGWAKGGTTPIHDHAGSEVAVIVTDGVLSEDFFITEGKRVDLLTQQGERTGAMQVTREIYAPSTLTLPTPYIHKMYNTDRDYTISIHSYYPPLDKMGFYAFKPGAGVEGGRSTGDLSSTGQWGEETVPMKGVLIRKGYPEYDTDQERDERGRWGGGESASAGYAGLIERVGKPDSGFTVSMVDGQEPSSGYAVSPYPTRSKGLKPDQVTLAALATYVQRNRDVLAQEGHYLGAWSDPADGVVYLDISIVADTEQAATALAKQHDQIAYFDLRRGQSVEVNRAATSGGQALPHKRPDGILLTRARKEPYGEAHAGADEADAGGLDRPGQAADGSGPDAGRDRRRQGDPRRRHVPVTRGYPEFDEDQVRDEHGRWSGGGGAATAEDDEAGFQALEGQGASDDWLPSWASPLTRTRLKEFELRVGGNDFETGFAIHAETGRIILENGGEKNQVAVTEEEGRAMQGQIFSHNHPGGRSFSAQDIATSAKLNLREVRVVGQTGYLYSMRPHGRTWPLMQELKEAYNKADEKAYLHAANQIKDGKMTLNEANALHHHLIWEDVAAKLGMTYTRKRWKSDDSAGQMELRLVRGISDGQNA